MTKMSLSKALQTRKRLKGEIKRVSSIVGQHNSCRIELDDEKRVAKVKNAMADRKQFVEMLTELESARAKANVEIVGALKQRDELKAEAEFIRQIPTTTGKTINNRYDDEPDKIVEYAAVFSHEWATDRLAEIEGRGGVGGEIDQLQSKIDDFNATHFIEVSW